jgi:hypothetical protein
MARPDPSAWKLPRLRITRDGTWLHEGEEVTHPGILATLWESLRVDEAGHYMEIGPVRVPVEVEDAPFVVVRVEPDDGTLTLTLSDLTREPLSPESLRFGVDGVPHCRVKGDRFRARLSRAATYQLLQHVEHEADGVTAALVVGGTRYALGDLAGDIPPEDCGPSA